MKAVQECREKYPQYEVHHNPNINNEANDVMEQRKNDASLLGIIQDIHMLSLTNFVVCTMTSNVRLTKSSHSTSASNKSECLR